MYMYIYIYIYIYATPPKPKAYLFGCFSCFPSDADPCGDMACFSELHEMLVFLGGAWMQLTVRVNPHVSGDYEC